MRKFQLDTEPREQIHGVRHALLLFDAQAVPPAFEFIGEEHRTFHIMNIDENEYSGQEGWGPVRAVFMGAAAATGASG
jgi:hypothetical protein